MSTAKSESKTGDGKTDDVSEKQKSPKKTNKWTNFWRDCYQQHFGMENLEKNTLTEFPIPMPDDNYFGLFMAKLKAALMFIFGALVNRRRSTHPVGVGAIGDFQVIENPKIPKNAFFSKSKKYSIILRHSNAVGVKLADKDEFDDAALEIRGCSIKFSCQSDESDFDLHLNTGEFAGFFNLPSFLEFVYQSATFNEALYKVFATKYPSSVKAVIDGFELGPFHAVESRLEHGFEFIAGRFAGVIRIVVQLLHPLRDARQTRLLDILSVPLKTAAIVSAPVLVFKIRNIVEGPRRTFNITIQ